MKEVITYYKEENSGLMYIPIKDKKACNKNRGSNYWGHKDDLFSQKRIRNMRCECGQFITPYSKSHHVKTDKHKELLDPEKKHKYMECECGEVMTPNNYIRHQSTKRHFINLQRRLLDAQNVSSS